MESTMHQPDQRQQQPRRRGHPQYSTSSSTQQEVVSNRSTSSSSSRRQATVGLSENPLANTTPSNISRCSSSASASSTLTDATLPPMVAETKEQRKRRQSRIRKRRHRDRQASKAYNLILDINQLKQENAVLERKRQFLLAHLRNQNQVQDQQARSQVQLPIVPKQQLDPMVQMAKVYMEMIRHGMRQGSPHWSKQNSFLHQFFAAQVLCGDQLVPPEAYVTHWQRVPECNPGFDIQLHSIHASSETYSNKSHQGARPRESTRNVCANSVSLSQQVRQQQVSVVRMDVISTSYINEKSLEAMFPHVLNDPLTLEQLLGRKLVIYGTVFCYFNPQRQVVCNMVDLDICGAITKLLETPTSVVKVITDHTIPSNFLMSQNGDSIEVQNAEEASFALVESDKSKLSFILD